VSPRLDPATAHELTRATLLAGVPGETLRQLAARMHREAVAPGEAVVTEGETNERFYIVLSGLMTVDQVTQGPRGVLRPGDYFGEIGAALGFPRTATVRALTPATVASCERATFDEFLRPLFSDAE
jgi:CRP-like cAMP-binding protein